MGQVLKIKEDDAIPADLVLLSCSSEDGSCYIETGALDGEKNLKKKNTITEIQAMVRDGSAQVPGEKITISAATPSMNLYNFEGKIELDCNKLENALSHFVLNIKQFLLRGAFLRNTEWAIGVVM